MNDDEYINNLSDEIHQVHFEILKTENLLFDYKNLHVDQIKAAKRAYKEMKREVLCNFRYGEEKFRNRYKKYKATMKKIKMSEPKTIADVKEADLKETQQAKIKLKALKLKYANLVTEYEAAMKERNEPAYCD